MNTPQLIIAGSGRSGTTWVLDCIAKANNLRPIFEPLNPIGVSSAKGFANIFLTGEDQDPELKAFLDKVLSGKLRSLWVNYRMRPNRLKPTLSNFHQLLSNYNNLLINYRTYKDVNRRKSTIVKFIRANLMLGWLSENYQSKILLIVRHPGAVIASKLKLGGQYWSPAETLKQYLDDKKLVDKYLSTHKYLRMDSLSVIESYTLIWCIENMIPLSQANKYGYCVVFFENLLVNGDREWKRIIDYFGLLNIPPKEIIERPSQQAPKDIIGKKIYQNQISKWKEKFSKKEVSEIGKILDLFEVPFYSAMEPMPLQKV
jgi:hypothetical protein